MPLLSQRVLRTILASVFLATLAACSSESSRDQAAPPAAAPAPAQPAARPAEEPAAGPGKPLRVGFDVDDTLLFSTPAFDAGFAARETKAYSKEFWTIVNGSDDGRSLVKKKAKEILEKHRNEGAELFVITSRDPPGGDELRKFLQKTFGIPPENVFFETGGKAERIRELKLSIYYGDSDSDIKAAADAGARGVRILRSPKSSYKKKYNPGKYEEEIVEGSED